MRSLKQLELIKKLHLLVNRKSTASSKELASQLSISTTSIFRYLSLFFLSFLSCKNGTVVPPANTATPSSITIKLDTEDHLYKLNDNWYRWAEDYESCTPIFYAQYAITSLYDAKLIIKHCTSAGDISMESLIIDSSDCDDSSIDFTQYEEGDLLVTEIIVSSDFNFCMLENSGVVSLNFDFFE